jgi:peptide-methionine (S)-S-oxide reductase
MQYKSYLSLLLLVSMISISCAQPEKKNILTLNKAPMTTDLQIATFGAGCFWCIEAILLDLKGVKKVASGYMGGKTLDPTYKEVCTGTTGHAEVCQVTFDPKIVSYEDLLQVFWEIHDPTTLNSQGGDHGTQYRSVVFYHNDAQQQKALFYKNELDKSGAFQAPLVTEITAASTFYVAEAYHQNYYNLNGDQPYCKFVIQPKVDKFKKAFAAKLK